MGFEPTRAEHNGLAVHHLNHSATSSSSGLADKKPDSVIFPAFRFNRITEKLTINVPKHVNHLGLSLHFPAFRFNRITEKLTINVPKHVNHLGLSLPTFKGIDRRGWDSNPRVQSTMD